MDEKFALHLGAEALLPRRDTRDFSGLNQMQKMQAYLAVLWHTRKEIAVGTDVLLLLSERATLILSQAALSKKQS